MWTQFFELMCKQHSGQNIGQSEYVGAPAGQVLALPKWQMICTEFTAICIFVLVLGHLPVNDGYPWHFFCLISGQMLHIVLHILNLIMNLEYFTLPHTFPWTPWALHEQYEHSIWSPWALHEHSIDSMSTLPLFILRKKNNHIYKKQMFPPGVEPGTFWPL